MGCEYKICPEGAIPTKKLQYVRKYNYIIVIQIFLMQFLQLLLFYHVNWI
jgi:hypothetical protein